MYNALMVFFCNYFLVQIAQVFHERDARRDLDARDLVLGDAVEVLEQAADRVAVRRHEHLPRERQPRRGGRGPKPRADAHPGVGQVQVRRDDNRRA